jgi:hypothetical protein
MPGFFVLKMSGSANKRIKITTKNFGNPSGC